MMPVVPFDYVEKCEAMREEITRLSNVNHQLRIRLLAFVSCYDRTNPMRTADVHDPDCGCLRCERDRAGTQLAKGNYA